MFGMMEVWKFGGLEVCFFVRCSVFGVFEMRNLGLESTTEGVISKPEFEKGMME